MVPNNPELIILKQLVFTAKNPFFSWENRKKLLKKTIIQFSREIYTRVHKNTLHHEYVGNCYENISIIIYF
jgi:hypothetical protein